MSEATLKSKSLLDLCQTYASHRDSGDYGAPVAVQIQNELIRRKKLTGAQLADIKTHTIRTGMPEHIAICSWGPFSDVNQYGGIYGAHNQFVIGDYGTYIYTENGRVTSWQQ
jgi:hypothetical protein